MAYYKVILINGKQIKLHRYIMETHLGRSLLPNEFVHHIDGDVWNNELSNLQIVSKAEHNRIHKHQHKYEHSYNLNFDKQLDSGEQMNKYKEIRLSLKLTQKQFGNLMSVGQSAVAQWENGENKPGVNQLVRMAEITGVSISELIEARR